MKNKSTRHKEHNIFKFQPFSERISNLNVNVFYRIGHENEAQAENETTCHFYQTIEKWNVLNLAESYGNFKKEVKPFQNITLTQLLYNKDHIAKVLLEHLKRKDVLCLQALLEVLVAFVQDLHVDFYQYYPDFLNVLIDLLNTKDTEQLEWTFICLAYIFKLLWRILIKDIDNVFNLLLPLLSDDRPEYINNFAAEGFAFVARKVKDKKSFLLMILRTVQDTKDGISGSGRLLFEIVKGVNGQFHSCCEDWFSLYFELLQDNKFSSTLSKITEEVIKHTVHNIHFQNSEVFWRIVTKYTYDTLLGWRVRKQEKYLIQMLQCVGQAIEYRAGRFLLQPDCVIGELIELFSIEELPEDILLSATKIVILLLLSKNIGLSQEQASLLTRTVLNVQIVNVFLFFIENIFQYSSFEALILPSYLQYCLKCGLDDRSLKILAKLIQTKAPLVGSGVDVHNLGKYLIDFNSAPSNSLINDVLLKHITINKTDIYQNESNYVYSLICLPHIKNSIKIEKLLLDNITALCEIIEDGQNIKRCLFLLLITLESAVRITEYSKLTKFQDSLFRYILPLCNSIEYIGALKILDMFLTVTKEETVNMENIMVIHKSLQKNFSSPYHEVRLYTTHIYSLFDAILNQQHINANEEWSLFSTCYKIQCIRPHVHSYREQLIYFDKLNFDRPQMFLCKETEFAAVPVRYLCGTLYMNFKLLWDPVIKIIASHANGLEMNTFWQVFVEELKMVVVNVAKEEDEIETCSFNCDLIDELYSNTYRIEVKPDFSNYRLLLWKAMSFFPEIAEPKTRDVSALLLDFVENEYVKSSTENALTWNIKQNDPPDTSKIMDNDLEETEKDEETELPAKSKGKYNMRTLIQHLEVFARIRSAKSMYREPELYKLYLELLSHKNSAVQKVALDCIMTYKFKYLTPYKEHLYNLIDDKNFKNEVVAFKVDPESSMIQEEHRNEIIPMIMNIVFSKMVSKTGLRTGGKSSGQFRRNIIFRFLAGCRQNEMMNFIHMAFRYYNNYLNTNQVLMINTIFASISLEKFIPPKRLQSSLNMMHVVLEQFGALMGNELLNYLIKVMIIIGAFIKVGFDQQSKLHAGYILLFRNMRTSCIKIVNKIFSLFENYPWTSNEINAIYDVFVWPYLSKLPMEGIHSPTALLKLLATWGTYPHYFKLLVKHHDDDKDLYPLSIIISLFLNEKSHISVYNLILEVIEKLLTLEVSDEDIQIQIPVTNELPISKDLMEKLYSKENFNYGSCILLPHASRVLQKLKRKLESKSRSVNQRELSILARISELVWEPEISDKLLQLLIPSVFKKCCQNSNEEEILQLMTALNNLLVNVLQPETHLKQISPLFGEVTHVSCRKLLGQLLSIVSKKSSGQFILIDEIMAKMNAWDSKWVNQPDFQVRGDTFKQVQAMILENSISLELGVLLIYNCIYTLKSEKDLALKENASHCMKTIAPYLVKKYSKISDRNYILDETLFHLIRQTLKSKNSDPRNECILLLGCLSRECPDAHVVLRDLQKLTNSQDLEVDFFENLTHLQVHRHGRALLKFSTVYKEELTLPNIRTLTQFVLPLTTHYFCNEKYKDKHSLIDAANDALGTICRLLPWHQYEGLLKFYLSMLRRKVDYQKQLVKLIVTILDSFHFNLYKAQFDNEVAQNSNNAVDNEAHLNASQIEEKVDALNENVKSSEEEGVEIEAILDELEKLKEDSEEDEEQTILMKKATYSIKAYEKIMVLCKSTATRVIQTIQIALLPQLHKILAEMTHHESNHKINRKKISAEKEEEDLLRVPISLALVKLLQKLPREILDSNLPQIFIKLCTFLKSHLESVRRVARETLQKIMMTLGPSYLGLLLDEMVPLLSKGFQVHVLVYTVHSVLVSLKEMFKPKDIDIVLNTVIKLCNADLFGILAEEKEVEKIISKVYEAKSTKSFDTYHILGQYITKKCMMDLVLPIKKILSTSHSFKTVNKAQECLRHIALGLIDNDFIPSDSLLKFSFGIASESIPELFGPDKPILAEKEREKLKSLQSDCFIIPKEPVYKSGHRISSVKSSNKTNAYIMIEFGLKLCHLLLKRNKIREAEFQPFLDPFVPIFRNCLTSKNVKLNTITLQCLAWILKYELPSLKDNITEVVKSLFEILHKYGAAGLSKGENFDLVVAAFKAMTILVRDVKYFIVDTEQLKTLLLYVEQDLYDHERQAIAFGLLKAILCRKLVTSELFDIMNKVAELSITSELPHVRLQSRNVSHQFLMDYPLGKRLDKHVTFYLAQLKYEVKTGRESALEMVQTLINSFPIKTLKEYCGTLLVTLGARLINDPEPSCKKMVADCINTMFNRLSYSDREPLFNIIKVWLSEDNVTHRQLATQLCGILVTVEKATFEKRLHSLMPLLKSQFDTLSNNNQPGKFVRLRKENEINSEELEKMKDHHLFQTLQLLLKISAQCPIFLKQVSDVEEISKYTQQLLAYPHEWVRLGAAQLLGFVLSSIDIKQLEELLLSNSSGIGYLHSDPYNDIKSLTLNLCDQLHPNGVKSNLAEQVVKNLVFIARVLQNIPINGSKINLLWLTRRMRKIVNSEIVETPSNTTLRTEVFKWIAGIVTALDLNNLQPILHHLLAPLVREMVTTDESETDLRRLSKDVANLIKKKIGMEKYTDNISKLEQQLSIKRAERKRSRNQLAVTDPEIFARKKIKHHEKKKEAKKRKISERKGSVKKFKRKKLSELDSSEIM
ncbi:HEAT domain-containing protein [Oryctes borbonicus]|uniref:HEAT domain-containing protein n=1 Tax=Oryctes borbonicus TaxID=1629725 RepID=A0A0T6BBJ4_9SCAR|nr:HEAT domain-containing protein [Oryctes borbonicus]